MTTRNISEASRPQRVDHFSVSGEGGIHPVHKVNLGLFRGLGNRNPNQIVQSLGLQPDQVSFVWIQSHPTTTDYLGRKTQTMYLLAPDGLWHKDLTLGQTEIEEEGQWEMVRSVEAGNVVSFSRTRRDRHRGIFDRNVVVFEDSHQRPLSDGYNSHGHVTGFYIVENSPMEEGQFEHRAETLGMNRSLEQQALALAVSSESPLYQNQRVAV